MTEQRNNIYDLRLKFFELMEAKEGPHFTLGYMKSALIYGLSTKFDDPVWIETEIAKLDKKADYVPIR